MSDIIEQLRDDSNYDGEVGRQYLSNSDIGTLLTNPAEFGVKREDNVNFAKGRLFHQSILEPDKARDFLHIDVSTRTTKAYKEFIAEHNVPFCLLTKEVNEILDSVEKMMSNFTFFSMIFKQGATYEQPAVGEIMGRMWKGKADIVTDDAVYDLKTTGDINSFARSAKRYNYDSQAYIYEQLFGKRMQFLVIDKTTGCLGHYTVSDEFVLDGARKVSKAIEVYDRYFSADAPDDISSFYITDVL